MGVPVGVIDDNSVSGGQIDSQPPSTCGQQEDKGLGLLGCEANTQLLKTATRTRTPLQETQEEEEKKVQEEEDRRKRKKSSRLGDVGQSRSREEKDKSRSYKRRRKEDEEIIITIQETYGGPNLWLNCRILKEYM